MNTNRPGRDSNPRSSQSGFSILEMAIVLLILIVVLSVVFTGIVDLHQKTLTESSKLDIIQSGREFLDEMARDLHQCGSPSLGQFASGSTSSQNISAGLVSFSSTDIEFEGDVDGDGTVNEIRYTLIDSSGTWSGNQSGTCPCTLERSQVAKVAGGSGSQTWNSYNTELQNVINSDATTPTTISGSSGILTGTGYVSKTNDSYFANYKTMSVFRAFKSDGTEVTVAGPSTVITSTSTLNTITTIRITLNMMSPNFDIKTGIPPTISLTASARVGNN